PEVHEVGGQDAEDAADVKALQVDAAGLSLLLQPACGDEETTAREEDVHPLRSRLGPAGGGGTWARGGRVKEGGGAVVDHDAKDGNGAPAVERGHVPLHVFPSRQCHTWFRLSEGRKGNGPPVKGPQSRCCGGCRTGGPAGGQRLESPRP